MKIQSRRLGVRVAARQRATVATTRNQSHSSTINNASHNGLLVHINDNVRLSLNSIVNVDAVLRGKRVRLPAIVQWCAASDSGTRVGVSLQLGALDRASREAYFGWFSKAAKAQGLLEEIRRSLNS